MKMLNIKEIFIELDKELNAEEAQHRDYLHEHWAKISTKYMQRTANLLKLDRVKEARKTLKIFNEILGLWEIQQSKMQEAAIKDGSEKIRQTLNVK